MKKARRFVLEKCQLQHGWCTSWHHLIVPCLFTSWRFDKHFSWAYFGLIAFFVGPFLLSSFFFGVSGRPSWRRSRCFTWRWIYFCHSGHRCVSEDPFSGVLQSELICICDIKKKHDSCSGCGGEYSVVLNRNSYKDRSTRINRVQ